MELKTPALVLESVMVSAISSTSKNVSLAPTKSRFSAWAPAIFNQGFELYKQGSWDKAIKQFKGVLKANPNDICAQMYIERCDILKKRKPKKWDGVWVMTSK